MARFDGSRAILSGPAAGVVGFSEAVFNPLTRQPVIGFDMGGTSTDVRAWALVKFLRLIPPIFVCTECALWLNRWPRPAGVALCGHV